MKNNLRKAFALGASMVMLGSSLPLNVMANSTVEKISANAVNATSVRAASPKMQYKWKKYKLNKRTEKRYKEVEEINRGSSQGSRTDMWYTNYPKVALGRVATKYTFDEKTGKFYVNKRDLRDATSSEVNNGQVVCGSYEWVGGYFIPQDNWSRFRSRSASDVLDFSDESAPLAVGAGSGDVIELDALPMHRVRYIGRTRMGDVHPQATYFDYGYDGPKRGIPDESNVFPIPDHTVSYAVEVVKKKKAVETTPVTYKSKGSYIGEVTSTTSSTAFPKNGDQGDYWYEYVGAERLTTDAEDFDPSSVTIDKEIVDWGKKINLLDNIKGLPDGCSQEDVTSPVIDTKKSGTYTGKVKVTFKDKSSTVIEVPVEVKKSDAERFKPEVSDENIVRGQGFDLTDNIKNKPDGATVKDVSNPKVDNNKGGKQTGSVEITFPDGSKKKVDVVVNITDICEDTTPLKNRIKELEGKVADLEGQVKAKTEELQKAKDQCAANTEKLEKEIANKNKEIEDLKNQVKTAEELIEELKKELNKLQEEIDKTKSELEKAKGELESLKKELEAEKEKAAKEKKELEDKLKENENKIKELEDKVKDIDNKKKDLQDELDKEKAKSDADQDKIKDLENKIKDLDGEKEKAEKEIETIVKENQSLKEQIIEKDKEIKTLTEKIIEKENEIKGLESKIKELEKEKENLIIKIKELIRDSANKDKLIKELQREIDALRKEIDRLAKEQVEKTIEVEKLKKELQSMTKIVEKYKSDLAKSQSELKKEREEHEKTKKELDDYNYKNRHDKKSRDKKDKKSIDNADALRLLNQFNSARNSSDVRYIFTIGNKNYIKLDGANKTSKKMDVAPYIKDDRTMMPLRYVGEAIGATVGWDNTTRTAIFVRNGLTARIQIDGNKIVMSNGKVYEMDAKPDNINDRIFVSLTNVSKVFNLTNGNTEDNIDQNIEWNNSNKTVTISL